MKHKLNDRKTKLIKLEACALLKSMIHYTIINEIWPHVENETPKRAATILVPQNPLASITSGTNRPHCAYRIRQVPHLLLVETAKVVPGRVLIMKKISAVSSNDFFCAMNPRRRAMKKTEHLQVCLEPRQAQKIARIREATGLTTSQVLRQLVEVAEVQTQFSAILHGNANGDVNSLAGSHVAVAA